MKRIMGRSGIAKSAFRSILLAVACALIRIPIAYAAISAAEAKEAVYQYCEEQFEYDKDQLEIYDFIARQEGGWAFGIKVLDADGTMKEIIRGEMDKNGKLLNLKERGGITLFEQLFEDYVHSQRSYEAMYAFKQKWERRLSQVDHEEMSKLDKHSSFPFSGFVQRDILLPSDTDISYEEAKRKSEGAILGLPGWTQEMLDHLRISLEVYHKPARTNISVYQFVYRIASSVGQVEAAILGIDYTSTYNRLSKEEDRIFGKARPWNVSVRIDERNGEQIGDIFIDTPPTKYTDLDFILWE